MKTLDEVIKAFEWCIDDSHDDCDGCPYDTGEVTDCHDRNVDALHYLRNYRDSKEWLDLEKKNYAEAVKNCERAEAKYTKMVLDMKRNDPLTWDELTQMDMQPVWYESLYWGVKTWAMVLVQREGIYIEWYHRCQDGQIIKGNKCAIYKDQQGERWQAYRKERS